MLSPENEAVCKELGLEIYLDDLNRPGPYYILGEDELSKHPPEG